MDGRVRVIAQELEAPFLAPMLATLNQTLGQGLTSEDGDQDICQDKFNQEAGRLFSWAGGIGVADAILRELPKMQEVA